MRITHADGEHLLALSEDEASVLVDACALLVLASQSAVEAKLPPKMASVLSQLFEGLQPAAAATGASEQNGSGD